MRRHPGWFLALPVKLPLQTYLARLVSSLRRAENRLGAQAGQAMAEYILIIGLVTIFLLTMLIAFRNAIADFTNEVVAFIQSSSGPPAIAAASPPPPPAAAPVRSNPRPAPSPSPTPTPEVPEQLRGGLFCGPNSKAEFTMVGPGIVTFVRIHPDGRRDPPATIRLVPAGPGVLRAERLDGSFIHNYYLLDPDTFRLGDGIHEGQTFRRC